MINQNFNEIANLNLQLISKKMVSCNDLPVSLEQVKTIEKWYKRFLFLFAKYDRPLAVSNLIDKYWHQHILDTRRYSSDCLKVFGRILHHNPYVGMNGKDDEAKLQVIFEQTDQLMFLEFGETMQNTLSTEIMMERNSECLLPALCSSDCSADGGDSGNDSPVR